MSETRVEIVVEQQFPYPGQWQQVLGWCGELTIEQARRHIAMETRGRTYRIIQRTITDEVVT